MATLILTMTTIGAGAQTTDERLRAGNARFLAGDVSGALEAYGRPAPDADAETDLPRLRLARATAQLAALRQRAPEPPADPSAQLAALESEFRAVVQASSDDSQTLRVAQANLGALLLDRAEHLAPKDRPLAADLFDQAAAAYLAAYRLDRSDADAGRNVEHARRRAQELRADLQQNPPNDQEQQSQQQRQQDRQRQDQSQDGGDSQDGESEQEPAQPQESEQQQAQDLADQLQDLADRQAEEGNQSASGKQDDQASQQQQDLSQQAQEALEDLERQQQEQERSQPGDQDPSTDTRPSMDRARQALDQARHAQQQAQEALEQGDSTRAAEAQHEAADHLSDASEAMQQAAQSLEQQAQGQDQQPEGQNQPQADQPSQSPAQPAAQEPESDPLVEQLLDRERRLRAQRALSRPGRPIRVERDW